MSVDAPANDGETNLDDFSKEFFGTSEPGVQEVEVKTEQEVEEEVHDEDSIVDESEVESDEAPADEGEAEADTPKKKKSVQERMNELTRQRYDAERRELETQRKLQELQNELTQLRNPKQEPAQKVEVEAAPDPEAKLENGEAKYALGEFDPEYIRDLARHTIKQEQVAAEAYRKEAEAAAATVRAREESQAKFAEKLTAYEAEDPEIQNKIMSLDSAFSQIDQNYGQYLIDIVRELDNSPAVLAYLADNPDTARKIVNSGAAQATIALGRLDGQVAKAKTLESKKVTKAPEPPIRTRGTSGQFQARGDTDNLDDFEKVFFAKKSK